MTHMAHMIGPMVSEGDLEYKSISGSDYTYKYDKTKQKIIGQGKGAVNHQKARDVLNYRLLQRKESKTILDHVKIQLLKLQLNLNVSHGSFGVLLLGGLLFAITFFQKK